MFGRYKTYDRIMERMHLQEELLRRLVRELGRVQEALTRVEESKEKADGRVDRMCDRLLEMTLIQSGREREAVAIRRLPAEHVGEPEGTKLEEDGTEWFNTP